MKKIAIRIPNWIGDAVLGTPFVKQARKLFRKDRIFLVMRKAVQEVFRNNPHFDRMLILDDKKKGVVRTGLFLQKHRFDLYFNLASSFSSHLICLLSGAPERYGFMDQAGILFHNHLVDKKEIRKYHRAYQYLMLLKPFSPELKNIRTEVFLTAREIKHGEKILRTHNVKRPVIGINVNCSAESRRWLKERFARLADILLKKKRASIIFFGNPEEKPYVDSVISLMEQSPLNLAGATSLREYISILKSISLFITNDSGPMHLANAIGTPVIALEGAADVHETGMLNKTRHIYINKNVACSPCVKNQCRFDMECMKAIEVEDVLKAVDRIIGK